THVFVPLGNRNEQTHYYQARYIYAQRCKQSIPRPYISPHAKTTNGFVEGKYFRTLDQIKPCARKCRTIALGNRQSRPSNHPCVRLAKNISSRHTLELNVAEAKLINSRGKIINDSRLYTLGLMAPRCPT
ncbi:unnamed protein product, partial [Ectocarpus fasciculatus]